MLSRVERAPFFIAGHALTEAGVTCMECGERILYGQLIMEAQGTDGDWQEFIHEKCVPDEPDTEG